MSFLFHNMETNRNTFPEYSSFIPSVSFITLGSCIRQLSEYWTVEIKNQRLLTHLFPAFQLSNNKRETFFCSFFLISECAWFFSFIHTFSREIKSCTQELKVKLTELNRAKVENYDTQSSKEEYESRWRMEKEILSDTQSSRIIKKVWKKEQYSQISLSLDYGSMEEMYVWYMERRRRMKGTREEKSCNWPRKFE